MPADDASLLTDKSYLTRVQYRTAANLAARQSIYQFRQPELELPAAVLDLAGLTGAETLADIGCGNGPYLAELARRGHGGRVLGVDLSAGMLRAARAAAPTAGLAAGDAVAIPLADGVTEVTLAPHMLYHVPDRPAAVRELRRITRDGGAVLVVLNGADHLRELREVISAASADVGVPAGRVWAELGAGTVLGLDTGAELLASVFGTVERHDFRAELVIPSPQPVLDYVRSMRGIQALADTESLLAAVARRIQISDEGTIRIRSHAGCLVCR